MTEGWRLSGPEDTPRGRVWAINCWLQEADGFGATGDARIAEIFCEPDARMMVAAQKMVAALVALVQRSCPDCTSDDANVCLTICGMAQRMDVGEAKAVLDAAGVEHA